MGLKFIKQDNTFDIQLFDDVFDTRLLRYSIGFWLEDIDISDFKVLAVKLCLEEAIFNAMQHAYNNSDQQQKMVDIKIEKTDHLIHMSIRDHGKKDWFKNFKFPDKIELNKINSINGRGLIIIKALSQEIKVTNDPDQGTTVDITINLLEDQD